MKILSFILLLLFMSSAFAADKESAYDRALRTGELRCGYIPYPPAVMIDPNTRVFSGIVPEVMEEAGKLLGLKIVWAEELGWGTTVDAIRADRVDALCVGFWENPAEGKYIGFSAPLWYSAVNAYVRGDDHRFDKDLSAIDDAKVTVISSDGEMAGIIARQDFPKANLLSLPNMTGVTEQINGLVTKKADVTFVETYLGEDFLAHNPGTIRNVSHAAPLRVFANTIGLPMGDTALQLMLNAAFHQIINSGQMEKILTKYETYPGSLLRVGKPYEAPK